MNTPDLTLKKLLADAPVPEEMVSLDDLDKEIKKAENKNHQKIKKKLSRTKYAKNETDYRLRGSNTKHYIQANRQPPKKKRKKK